MGRQRDIFEQIRAIESWQAREHAAVSRAAAWTPQQASDAAAIARMFPAIRPGVVTALVRHEFRMPPASHPFTAVNSVRRPP